MGSGAELDVPHTWSKGRALRTKLSGATFQNRKVAKGSSLECNLIQDPGVQKENWGARVMAMALRAVESALSELSQGEESC